MKLVHYSKNDAFRPKGRDNITDQGKRRFFYPVGNHVEWQNRTPSYWIAPDEIVIEVQRFDAGEFDNENEVIEVFVKAKDLKKLTEV